MKRVYRMARRGFTAERAMLGAAVVSVLLALSSGCGDSTTPADPDAEAPIPRLIPSDDSDYSTLELPEQAGECALATDCEPSCVHSCALIPTGPVTCPIIPEPMPQRLQDSSCECLNTVCAWSVPTAKRRRL